MKNINYLIGIMNGIKCRQLGITSERVRSSVNDIEEQESILDKISRDMKSQEHKFCQIIGSEVHFCRLITCRFYKSCKGGS